ncbi:hypothetical protein ABPG73_000003 [Tetrahymena malaccensis]
MEGVQINLDQSPIDLPSTGNRFDGSFFSYEIIIDTKTVNKTQLVLSLRNFAIQFAPLGGNYPCLSIIMEEKWESQVVGEQEEDQEEEDISLLKNMLLLMQEQIKKLQISQQQIKEQQKEIQDTLTKIEVSSVKNEINQIPEKVNKLYAKISKDEQILKQIEISSKQVTQMILLEHEVQQFPFITSPKQEQINEQSEKQNNNIEVQQIERYSTKSSEDQIQDESFIQSQLNLTSSDKLVDSTLKNTQGEVKINKSDENKDNQQFTTKSNKINEQKDNLSNNNPQSKSVQKQLTKEEFQQNQKQEQVKIDNNSSPKVQLNIQLNIHKINDN